MTQLTLEEYNLLQKCIAKRASAHYTNFSVRWKVNIPNTGKYIQYFAILSTDKTITYEYITYKNVWGILDGCRSKYYENVIEHTIPFFPRNQRPTCKNVSTGYI